MANTGTLNVCAGCDEFYAVEGCNLCARCMPRVRLTRPVVNECSGSTMWEVHVGSVYVGRATYYALGNLWQVCGWPVGANRRTMVARTAWSPCLVYALRALASDNTVSAATPVDAAVYHRYSGKVGTLVSHTGKDVYGYIVPGVVTVWWQGAPRPVGCPVGWLVAA